MKELGDAINETLANSDHIAEVIGRIKSEGYDVFLVLEATVGFNRREGEKAGASDPATLDESNGPAPDLEISAHDVRFLKSLRITVDEAA